jgi:DnaJ-domain-containing protein 1
MPDLMHVEILRAGSHAWNTWRHENPGIAPDLNDLKVSIIERQFGRVYGGPINLSLAELCRAGLDQATLIEANLTGAVLIDADLSDARLEKADLRGADLRNARLSYAALNDARLEAAILCGADLRDARGLTQAQIDQAIGDRRTTLPANLVMPRAWLQEGQPYPAQLAKQTDPNVNDQGANPYAVLGVGPGASIQEVRAAWVKLVKELHPDGSSGEVPASERLKSINQAYQRLKSLERHVNQGRAARDSSRSARAVFVACFLIPIATAALVVGVRTYLAQPDVAIREAGTSINGSKDELQMAHPSMSNAPSSQRSADEPFVGADRRLR